MSISAEPAPARAGERRRFAEGVIVDEDENERFIDPTYEGDTVIGTGVGPAGRISLQQLSSIKWSIALKDGYFLYVNVPKTELDETSSLNLLLEKMPVEDGSDPKSIAQYLKQKAESLLSLETASERPVYIQVAYRQYPRYEISVAPAQPQVEVLKATTVVPRSPPLAAELEFCLFCATHLPQHDVTVRISARETTWKVKDPIFGKEWSTGIVTDTSKPLDPESEAPDLKDGYGKDHSLGKAPFSTWSGAHAMPADYAVDKEYTLDSLVASDGVAEYKAQYRQRAGYLKLVQDDQVLQTPFEQLRMYAVKSSLSSNDDAPLWTMLDFYDARSACVARIFVRPDDVILQMRVLVSEPGKKGSFVLKRVPFSVDVDVSFGPAPPPSRLGKLVKLPDSAGDFAFPGLHLDKLGAFWSATWAKGMKLIKNKLS